MLHGHAVRIGRYFNPPPLLRSPCSSSPSARQRSAVSFCTGSSTLSSMDDDVSPENVDEKKIKDHPDVMADSFGEGYATRCDEEGFGGIYGGNQTYPKDQKPAPANVQDPEKEFDRSQGSEVKEKEKARHQPHPAEFE